MSATTPGDVVWLKSGGPAMTVADVSAGIATCCWWDEAQGYRWAELDACALELCVSGPEAPAPADDAVRVGPWEEQGRVWRRYFVKSEDGEDAAACAFHSGAWSAFAPWGADDICLAHGSAHSVAAAKAAADAALRAAGYVLEGGCWEA